MSTAAVVFLAASAVHVGFQLSVTVLVYPALSAVEASLWSRAHDLHSRRIVPVVGVVYGALVLTGGWLLVVDRGPWAWVGIGGAASAMGVTAFAAAPLHGRLREREDGLISRLLRVDRLRLAGAVLGLVGALGAGLR